MTMLSHKIIRTRVFQGVASFLRVIRIKVSRILKAMQRINEITQMKEVTKNHTFIPVELLQPISDPQAE